MPINLSGSLVLTGSLIATGGITMSGSIASASYAANATSASFAGDTVLFAGKPVTVFPTTGSNTFVGTQTITGSVLQSGSLSVNGCIVSTGQIVAQTINVQQVTSSIVYSCGSNIFGSALNNTQTICGNIFATGSVACFAGNVCVPNIISTGTSGGRYGTFNAPTNGGYITFEAGGTPFGDLGSYCAQYGTGDATTLLLGSRTGYALVLGTNSTERMRITSTGVVGINSTSPVENDGNLVVAGCVGTGQGITCTTAQINIWETTSGNKAGLWFGAVNCANVGVIGSRTATGNIAFQTYCGAWGERMRITYNGNVGIGTSSPVGKLDVSLLNTRRFIVTYDDSIITIKGASDTGAGENLRVIGDNLIFNTNSVGSGTERLRITSTGIACFACQVCTPILHATTNAQIGYGGVPAGTGKLFISRGDQYGLNINVQSGYARIQGDDDLLAINRGGVDILSMSICNHLGVRTTASPFAALRVCQCANNNDYAVRIQAVFGINDYLDSDANRIFGGGLSETQFLNGSSSRPAMISLGGNLATSEALGVINFFRSDNASTYRSRAQIWAATNGSGCSTTLGGYITLTTADTGQTNPTQKLTILSNGVACFACTVCAPTVVRCASKWVLNGAVEGGNNACALVINTDGARAVHIRGVVGGISGQTMTSMGMYEAILYRIGSTGGNESKRFAVLVDCNASPGNGQGIQMNVVNDNLYIQNKTGMSYAQTITVWAEIFFG